MTTSTSFPKKPSAFARTYHSVGFRKAYNFILWFIFAGALFGFTLARLQYFNFNIFCPTADSGSTGAAPGECYYYRNFNWYKIGIYLHLGGVLPASLIAVFQFTPFIRHKAILVHRVGGYIALLLWAVGAVGAFMVARRAFGGGLDVQAWVGVATIATTICLALAYVNIKRLQIEQHRAWMLRGWFIAGAIVTSRIIMIISTMIISSINSYYIAWPCAKIAFALNKKPESQILSAYPACAAFFDGTNAQQEAVVHASFSGEYVTEIGAALDMSFGMAVWVATVLHVVGVEIYLHLTPREAERLRNVSYQRQLEAGMRNPGSAGLTSLGDCEPWAPATGPKSDAECLEM